MGFGLYLHWPFCAAKCPYCDFNSHVARNIAFARWRAAFRREIERTAAETRLRRVETIYFGGGTPSLMPPELVAEVLEAIRDIWVVVEDAEITLEANPTSAEAARFRGYAEAGVNRLSIGVQALRDDALHRLGRRHSVAEALQAIEMARAIFPRVSFDLIYARQEQTAADWEKELKEALLLEPDHLSLYQLTIEPGTAFAARKEAGGLRGLPSEDEAVALYEITQELCTGAGLPAYETSNHARAGQECRHNLLYWRSEEWIGLGPGAHGRIVSEGKRVALACVRDPNAWLKQVEREGHGEAERHVLSRWEEAAEVLLMGLRLREGVETARLAALGYDINGQAAERLVALGLLEVSAERLYATEKGRFLIDAVVRELAAELPSE